VYLRFRAKVYAGRLALEAAAVRGQECHVPACCNAMRSARGVSVSLRKTMSNDIAKNARMAAIQMVPCKIETEEACRSAQELAVDLSQCA
jgi:hypothetical protein